MGKAAAGEERFPISPSGKKKEVQRSFGSQPTSHEVIVKFRRAQEEMIIKLLGEHSFGWPKIVRKSKTDCFAYCQFIGDIAELDRQLKELKSKAILSCGQSGTESTILEFFVDFDELSLTGPELSKLSGERRRRASALRKATIVAVIIAAVWGVYTILSPIVSKSLKLISEGTGLNSHRTVSTTEITRSTSLYPAWNMFILPNYQPAWSEVGETFGFNKGTMLQLLRRISSTGDSGHGQTLSDLTIYPGAIKRALSLVVLQNIRDFDQLQLFIRKLKGRYLYSQPFPDQSETFINALDRNQSENTIILSFYEQISKDPHFAAVLINEIWNSQKG